MPLAAILTELEQALADRPASAFRMPEGLPADTVPTGIGEIDRLTRGFPRGRITEISGTDSSGRTSLLLSTLAQRTANGEACGLIDPSGVFDPASAAAMGADLDRLLWVRAGRDLDPALQAMDLLLQGGGFGLIAADLGDFAPSDIRSIPFSTWFRLQRAVENTPTVVLIISREPSIGTGAALVLRLGLDRAMWSPRLLHGIRPRAEIIRCRTNPTVARDGVGCIFQLLPPSRQRAVAADGHVDLPGRDSVGSFPP